MTVQRLRRLVYEWWGKRLEQPDLDKMREDLVELQLLASPPPEDGVLVIEDAPGDYDAAMREFFGEVLVHADDPAFVQLWLTAVELWLALMAQHNQIPPEPTAEDDQ